MTAKLWQVNGRYASAEEAADAAMVVIHSLQDEKQRTLAALSEAVTHAQDQLPPEVAQAWVDAERLVWERLGTS